MAAAAAVHLADGTIDQIIEAVGLALKNVLGLVCDPVAGLVISPCIKRNALGVINAFLAAEMALSGVNSVIPTDEIIDALKRVGQQLPLSLRETGLGGIASSPTGKKLKKEIFGKK
jgi:L-serine dehydratase